jgi:hypothetical protein
LTAELVRRAGRALAPLATLSSGLLLAIVQLKVVLAFALVEMFDGVSRGRTWHGCCVPVEESVQPLRVALARFADPATDGLVDEGVLVVGEDVRDIEGVLEVASSDECVRCDDRGAPLQRMSARMRTAGRGACP